MTTARAQPSSRTQTAHDGDGALVKVERLRTEFATPAGTVKAVDGISYEVARGQTLGLVGESGCGKTVSVLSIMRLLREPPARVEALALKFDGRDLLALPREEMRHVRGREIGIVFQDPMTSLNPVLTVRRQLTERLEEHFGLSARAALDRAVELLEMVGISSPRERIGDYPHQFSGGMRQRVMIAMAISCHPKLLIADEPTTALDVTIQAQILDLIRRLREELDMAVIVITHDLGVIAGLCDHVAIMYAGHIVEHASVRGLFRTPKHPYSLGLLESISRIDREPKKLSPIPGRPPDLIDLPEGCPFAPRCRYVLNRCHTELPALARVVEGHSTRCWVDTTTGRAQD